MDDKKNTAASTPERQCIVTGVHGDKQELIRFVTGPAAQVVPDVAGKLPGRGMWVSCNKAILEQAIKRKAFQRAAKKQVTMDKELPQQVEKLLYDRVLQSLSFARKAGEAIAGSEKTREALASGTVIAMLHAEDAGEDGIKKLHINSEIQQFKLNRDDLARMMGRENVAHIALTDGNASRQCINELRRFTGFVKETTI